MINPTAMTMGRRDADVRAEKRRNASRGRVQPIRGRLNRYRRVGGIEGGFY